MRDLEQLEADMLRRARRGLSPTSDDQSRVLSATVAGAAVLGSSPSEANPALNAAPAGAAISRYFLGVLALGVAGAVGYGWGYRDGVATRPAPVVAATVPTSRGTIPVLAASGDAGRAPSEPAASARSLATPAELASSIKPKPPAASNSAASEPAPGLDEEVRQLRRIERAVRDGNPRLALVLAEDLDRTIPNGQLQVERSAAVMMSNCQLGTQGAAARAAKFVEQNPTSAYAARLKEICRLPGSEQRK